MPGVLLKCSAFEFLKTDFSHGMRGEERKIPILKCHFLEGGGKPVTSPINIFIYFFLLFGVIIFGGAILSCLLITYQTIILVYK